MLTTLPDISPAPNGASPTPLAEPWRLGRLEIPNRVLLAPLAGIGNWFVRLQAKRYGAGMAVSEMVSSHAIYHGNQRTCTEMLRIAPEERSGGPVSIQLFGADPEVMRHAAATVAERGADVIDINMGCPVQKVCKTGAGAALLEDHRLAVAVARAVSEGSGLPVTAKLRIGRRPGERTGIELARRLVEDAGVSAIALHPRSAAVRHKGSPEYDQVAALAACLNAPVILTGGLSSVDRVQRAFQESGATAVMLARGSLGNPWLFSRLLGFQQGEPTVAQVHRELLWTIEQAVEHMGDGRATKWLRKVYAWYVPRLGLDRAGAKALQERLQRVETLAEVRFMLEGVATEAVSGGPQGRLSVVLG